MPTIHGIETTGMLWIWVPAVLAVYLLWLILKLNTRYGYGRYNDMEKAIMKAWKRRAKPR